MDVHRTGAVQPVAFYVHPPASGRPLFTPPTFALKAHLVASKRKPDRPKAKLVFPKPTTWAYHPPRSGDLPLVIKLNQYLTLDAEGQETKFENFITEQYAGQIRCTFSDLPTIDVAELVVAIQILLSSSLS